MGADVKTQREITFRDWSKGRGAYLGWFVKPDFLYFRPPEGVGIFPAQRPEGPVPRAPEAHGA